MKKVLIVAAFILIVIIGSVLWIWRAMGVTDPALLLPAETVALASLPDLPRSILRWPQTTLAQIGVEPEMRAFLEKPLQYMTKNRGGGEASGVLLSLKPGRIFAAAVSVSSSESAMLIGFQYWGGKIAHDAAVARLRQELAAGEPLPELKREAYEGDEIASSAQKGVTIYNASHGQWGFISNSLPALKDALDRAAGRKKDGSLAESPRYKDVIARLVKSPDFLCYIQPQTVLETLLAIGQTVGAQAVPQQLDQIKKIEAIGIAIKQDGPDLRDSVFILRQNPPDVGNLSHGAMKLTSKATAAYFAFVADFRKIFQTGNNPAMEMALGPLQYTKLPQIAHEAFGPECALAFSWGDEPIPGAILAIKVKDFAKAEQGLQEILSLFPQTGVNDVGGSKYYSFPTLEMPFTSPTLTLTKDFLLVGLNPSSLQNAQQAAIAGEPVEKSPAFSRALSSYKSANEVFGYIDSRAIFEHGFPHLSGILTFSAAFVPGFAEVIDSSKLPSAQTIAKHLNPIVYSQTRLPNGYLIESSGPITLNQAIILGAVGGQYFMKSSGSEQ